MDTTNEKGEKSSSPTSAHPFRLFSLAEIQYATKNFDDELVIGQGGFGKVFKGYISSEEVGHVVAVKRLDSMSDQGEREFRAEIDMLSKLRHCHLVSLIGYCHENKEMILVYDFMPNGTLYRHLHKANTTLSWLTRLKIAIGAARGINYLHTSGVIHRDVKSSNILLDEKWSAMISDFGLSKVGPTNQLISFVDASVKGTFGYLDPEYFYTKKLTWKTDVYAFGVVLFELLSRRLPVDERNGEDQCSLVRWAQKCVKERKIDQMVDFNIKGTASPRCLRRFAKIAYRCVHSVPKERPTMTEVVASLQALLELQEKFYHTGESSSIMGFNWKVHKYFVSAAKPNLDQSGTNSPESLGNNLNEYEELVTREVKASDQSGTNSPKSLGNNMNEYEELVTKEVKVSDQSGTNSPKSLGNNMNEYEELVTREVKVFTYDELKLATRDFGNCTSLYEGGYGRVYKGWLDKMIYCPCEDDDTELPIAVRKLHCKLFDQENLKEFRHPNLINLVGYCLEDEYVFLVFQFMHRENLKNLLQSGAIAQLPLDTKVKILVGIARGIVFLQKSQVNKPWLNDSEFTLDINKILLDKDFTAKLSDYEGGHYNIIYRNIDEVDLALECCGYKVIFAEILTAGQDFNKSRSGKESLNHIADLCLEICNEVDSEAQILTILKEHNLIEFEEEVGLIQSSPESSRLPFEVSSKEQLG